MPQYRLTIDEIERTQTQHQGTQRTDESERVTERMRVTVDATGALDHAAILAAVTKTKRVYAPRKPKVQP